MKRFGKLLLFIVLVFGLKTLVFSEEKLVLTLEDCLNLALSQNPYYLGVKEKEEGAKAVVREAASRFFPTLDATGSDILDKKVFVLEFPSFIPGQPSQRIAMDFTKTYQFSLSFSLPLFTGGRLISGFKQANYNLQSTQESIRQSRQDTIFNVKKAFYGYLLAQKFAEVAEEAVGLAEKHYANVKNLYDAGMASRFDLLRSEVQVANLKPQLIRAKNSLSVAELGLKTLLGVDLSQPIELKGEMSFKPFEGELDEMVNKAVANRPEISQLNYQRQIAGEMLKMARAENLPTLAIGGAYNYWSNFLNFKKNNWESYYSVNLVLTLPIFSGFSNSAKIAQTKSLIKEIEFSQKGLIDMVKFEVNQAFLNLKQAKESLLSQEKNVDEAQESVRIAELNFSEGLATTLDVSSAQVALSQAKTNYSQALYDYVVSLAQLEKAMGIGGSENE
jgi:outer membrane protein TolC